MTSAVVSEVSSPHGSIRESLRPTQKEMVLASILRLPERDSAKLPNAKD